MLDFLMIATRATKRGEIEVYPKFMITKSSDLMIRGGDFYAIWVEERGLWSTDEQDAIDLIDRELDLFVKEREGTFEGTVRVLHLWDAETGMIDRWHRYCQGQKRDSFVMLDEKLIFSNAAPCKADYASKRLSYPLEKGDISAYDKLISTLYSPEERHKIEWAIGSIVCGDSKELQKFMVLYGSAGTGKSTILNIIQQLFHGYYSVFDAKALGSSTNAFALEAFKTNPLVAIQHDGDLSKIEDNTRLNSLVSHELMTVNEKFKSTYANRFKAFLFMGTNRPVKITDAKSGLIRRLIDVTPSGNKLSPSEYKEVVGRVSFELGAIAYHCQEVYLSNPGFYDNYIPIQMMGASNDFYNYVVDSFNVFAQDDGVTLKVAWEMYKNFCEDAKVPYPLSRRLFQEELKNYFREYSERSSLEDGTRVRSFYSGFRFDKFDIGARRTKEEPKPELLELNCTVSLLDKELADCPAQYATVKDTPSTKWSNVTSKLSELDTSKTHYVKPKDECHIVIDFDIKDKEGNKSLERNLEAASKWPPTYAELSKSGCGVHLHYIYSGDVSRLSRIYDDYIEIKTFPGDSSLRRRLTRCNDLPIATISSGLPLKGEDKVINPESVKSEKGLRKLIKRNLCKEIHPSTKSSIDFIHKILEDAYNSGLVYDVSDMYEGVVAFAIGSTNQADYCLKLVGKMKFKSEAEPEAVVNNEAPIVFYDVEVFPNLFLVNWKYAGADKPVVRMINPKPYEIEQLTRMRLIGFNCRRYDNHIMYGRMIGYTNADLYDLSQRIIGGDRSAFFGEAYNMSYTDVYDFSSKKQSLKKWEIELGIHHQELGLPWDEPVPEEMWGKVAEYCDNDVIATEKVFEHLQGDWVARQILSDVAGLTPNDTTNTLTTRIIFGGERTPQSQFNYRDLSKPVKAYDKETLDFIRDEDILPIPFDPMLPFDSESLLPYFPGYTYQFGKSVYRDEEVGEGGYVYAEPGMYSNVALLDVASMHPTSIICEVLFGPTFTKRFKDIKDARVFIKHKEYDKAKTILDGKLAPYIEAIESGNSIFTAQDLSQALKIAINSVYGLTAAGFANHFRDDRNVDNIVAKRGALFMVDLKHAVQERGFTVAHIKTDSIKIPNATPEIIEFVMEFGRRYGYVFEHEDTYERMCLVNDAVYIAKYAEPHKDKKTGEDIWWTATGAQFKVPYVFKTLFSKEPIQFEDMCETKSVQTALYLDKNENLPENEHLYVFVGKVGCFCPVVEGAGGGDLVRIGKDKNGDIKYYSAAGAKGFKWLEAETIKTLDMEDRIDRSYYRNMVDEAIATMSKYGDVEQFISGDPDFDLPFVVDYDDIGDDFKKR